MIFFTIIAICFMVMDLAATSDSDCADKTSFCPYIIGQCKYVSEVRALCNRSCGVCSVSCSNIQYSARVVCGDASTTQASCIEKSCCWDPSNPIGPWCYKSRGTEGK